MLQQNGNDVPASVFQIHSNDQENVRSSDPLLKWCTYALEFAAECDGELPRFPGSAIRGAFGHALKRLVCVMRNRPCEGCPLEFSCLYTTIFETRANPSGTAFDSRMRPPHPFVLKVSFVSQRQVRNGDSLQFGVSLFGNAVAAYPIVLRALQEACKRGLGSNRLRFQLKEIRKSGRPCGWKPDQSYPAPLIEDNPRINGCSCHWEIATPLRLRSGGKPVDHQSLAPRDLAMPVLRRLMLLVHHFGNPDKLDTPADMNDRASRLQLTYCHLKWKRLQRYSSRQSATHSVSGLLGVVGISFSDAPEWGPILAWAPTIHVGKATSMGLGRVELAQ